MDGETHEEAALRQAMAAAAKHYGGVGPMREAPAVELLGRFYSCPIR
jgi:hypothetical protein